MHTPGRQLEQPPGVALKLARLLTASASVIPPAHLHQHLVSSRKEKVAMRRLSFPLKLGMHRVAVFICSICSRYGQPSLSLLR